MGRDILELADDSLFIKKINHPLAAANARLLIRACPFSKERAFGSNPTHFQAADLLLYHDADAVTSAGALLAPLIWRGLADPGEAQKHSGRMVGGALEDLSSTFILSIDNPNFI
jgi:hypothetical protein